MLHFEGDKDLPQATADVWAKLSDINFLVQCVPDVESVTTVEKDTAALVIRPGFSFVRGTLELTLRVVEAVANQSIRVVAHTKGIGATCVVEVALAFTSQDKGTRLRWTTEVKELGGLLKAVPQGLIKAAAQKVIADVWTAVEAKLAEPRREPSQG